MADADNPKGGKQSYPLLAILLPFIGVIFGAIIENGTNGLCRLGMVHCRTPETEVTQLRSTVAGLQGNLKTALNIVQTCQNSLTHTASNLRSVNESIPPSLQAGGGFNDFLHGSESVSLLPFKTQLANVAQTVERQSQQISTAATELKQMNAAPLGESSNAAPQLK